MGVLLYRVSAFEFTGAMRERVSAVPGEVSSGGSLSLGRAARLSAAKSGVAVRRARLDTNRPRCQMNCVRREEIGDTREVRKRERLSGATVGAGHAFRRELPAGEASRVGSPEGCALMC